MNRRFWTVLGGLAIVFGTMTGAAGCTPSEPASETPAIQTPSTEAPRPAEDIRADLLISVDELAADTAGVVILDSRDPQAYRAGHIEGAINAPWQMFSEVTDGEPGDEDWGVLSAPDDIGRALGELGVDASKPIVVYSDPPGRGEDGRVRWTLRSVGLRDVRMLEGGYPAWAAAGKAISTDVPAMEPTTIAVAEGGLAELNVTTEEVKAAVEAADVKIVDARSAEEYGGATDFGEPRGGHIPGATNFPYSTLLVNDSTLRSNDQLILMLAEAGIRFNDEIIVYSTKGVRSAYVVEVMQTLGYSAKNYDASFYTWAGIPNLPVEK